MKRLWSAVLLLSAAVPVAAQSGELGVMLGNLGGSPQKRMEIAKELGANWYRPGAVFIDQANPICEDCDAVHAAGMKLVLVIRNGGDGSGKPSGPVRDVAGFEQKVKSALDRYKPELLVVENEPDNQKSFYTGTPEEYAAELVAACQVAHAANVKCADGGISSSGLAALVTDELWKKDTLEASDFAIGIEMVRSRVREPLNIFGKKIAGGKTDEQMAMEKATKKFLDEHRAEIDRAKAMLTAGENTADYVNFHWYELKPDYLPKVVSVIHQLAHRPVMSDEVGQKEERAFEVSEKLKQMRETAVAPVIWFAVDGKGGVVGLVDKDGKLRATGQAFQRAAGGK